MRRSPTKPGFQAAAAQPPLVDAPACGTRSYEAGYCLTCAYCRARVCGPMWWLMDRGAVDRAMLAAAVEQDACRRRVASARETFERVVGPITGELAVPTNGAAR